MATKTNSGFTIIETLLYLAVSSALLVAILFGVGASVTKQRYNDSVDSLKSYLQEQYGSVANTVNGRTAEASCTGSSGGSIVMHNVDPTGSGQIPGASECLIVGRYIRTVPGSNGSKLRVSNVIAYPKTGGPGDAATSDIVDLRDNYTITPGIYENEDYELAWNANLSSEALRSDPKVFSMLIVRSPRSGGIMTFTAPVGATTSGNPISAQGLATTGVTSMARTLELCVNGDRGMGLGAKLRQVRVTPYATSASAVQIPNESDSVCN